MRTQLALLPYPILPVILFTSPSRFGDGVPDMTIPTLPRDDELLTICWPKTVTGSSVFLEIEDGVLGKEDGSWWCATVACLLYGLTGKGELFAHKSTFRQRNEKKQGYKLVVGIKARRDWVLKGVLVLIMGWDFCSHGWGWVCEKLERKKRNWQIK